MSIERSPAELEASAITKCQKRLMWLLWACFMAALIDRYNIGYAAIPMRADLGLTATQFGVAITIFFLGYFLFEIPVLYSCDLPQDARKGSFHVSE